MRIFRNKEKILSEPATWFLDVLCIESLLILFRTPSATHVYYQRKSSILNDNILAFVEKCTSIVFFSIDDLSSSSERIGRSSAYEWWQLRSAQLSEELISSKMYDWLGRESGNHRWRLKKFFTQAAHLYFLGVVELELARKLKGKPGDGILIHMGIGSNFLESHLLRPYIFYKPWLSNLFSINKRVSSAHSDAEFVKIFSGRLRLCYHILRQAYPVLVSVIGRLVSSSSMRSERYSVGVEQLASRVRRYEPGDLFWLIGSEFKRPVTHLEFSTLDTDSGRLLSTLGVDRVRVCRKFSDLRDVLINNDCGLRPAILNFDGIIKVATSIIKGTFSIIFAKKKYWDAFYRSYFFILSRYWENIYKDQGLVLLWSMSDIAMNLIPKSQAMRDVGGMITGAYYSFLPMVSGSIQKQYDLFFHWGNISREMMSPYSIEERRDSFCVGYPFDYYFLHYKEESDGMKRDFGDKFVLTFIDNICGNDIPYSCGAYHHIYNMLLRILEKNENVLILLKPKRIHVLNEVLKDIPEVADAVAQQKISIFAGETARTKFVPAKLGMVSDLVLGLGLSTATLECFFSGANVVFLDLARFRDNPLTKDGVGHYVFHSIVDVENYICAAIADPKTLIPSRERLEKFSLQLDPYQDGEAGRRVGYVLDKYYDALVSGNPSILIDERLDALKC